MNELYSDKIMEHFRNPRNLGVIKDADGVGTVGNPNCGDVMRIFIKIKMRKRKTTKSSPSSRGSKNSSVDSRLRGNDKNDDGNDIGEEEYISDIKFQTLGCGAAIASSSIATELVKGKSLDQALKLSSQEIAKEMGKFPPAKYHCSILAEEGIKSAISDYRQKLKN